MAAQVVQLRPERPILPRPSELTRQTPRDPFERRLSALKREAAEVMTEFEDVSDFVRPRRGRFIGSQKKNTRRRSTKIINSTATLASRTLGSGMMSGVSSPARPWFNLTMPYPQYNEMADVKSWLYTTTIIIRLVLAKSNFYNSVQMFYRDLGDFGNACMLL